MSRKSERLVNLTIALLSTKRWITKSEIFQTVDGYEGEYESKERMFERDKDDLRSLGITIEVGTFDPLFDDEPGYRITPDNYRIQLSNLTPHQLAILSLAIESWRDSALTREALSALTRLKSIGMESDFDSLPILAPHVVAQDQNVTLAIQVLADKSPVSFLYIDEDLKSERRRINPYGVGTRQGRWYLAGFDLDRQALRVFRIDRISGDIERLSKSASYEIPSNFSMTEIFTTDSDTFEIILCARKGKASLLRGRAVSIRDAGEWDQITINSHDHAEIIREILWHLDDVYVVSPPHIRQSVKASLEELVASHG